MLGSGKFPAYAGGMLTPPIDRRILSIVEDRLAEAPVVVLQGARSVGKSTVLAELARRHDVEITDLESTASSGI